MATTPLTRIRAANGLIQRPFTLYFTLLMVTSLAIFVTLKHYGFQPEPYWLALPILCVPPAMMVIRKYPAALIPPILYVGSFKSEPDQSLSLTDPTFAALVLLCGTLVVHFLLAVLDLERPSMIERIKGQLGGIAAYGLFVAVVAFSYTYTRAPEYGFRAMTHFALIGSVVFFSALLVRDEKDFRHLIAVTLLFSMALVVYTVLTHRPETDADPTHIDVGVDSGLALLLLLLAPKSMRVPVPRWLLLLCVPLLAGGLVIAIARGPIVSFIVTMVIGFFVVEKRSAILSRAQMITVLALLTIPAIIVSVYWLQQNAPEKLETKSLEVSEMADMTSPGGTAGERLVYYQAAIKGFEEKPILGWGIGSFSTYARNTDMRLYPHNLVLMVAMEQGLVGLTALAIFLFAIGSAMRKTVKATRGEWGFLVCVMLYCFMTAAFSGSLDDQRELFLWAGLVFACRRIQKAKAVTPGRLVSGSTVPPPVYSVL